MRATWMKYNTWTKKSFRKFNVYGSVHRKYIPIYIQHDATWYSLFISGNCSTCFGWFLLPSSGAHTTVSTASVICHTVTAICRYSGGISTHNQERIQLYLQHLLFVTPLLLPACIAARSSNGVTNTRCCRYSCMRSWLWVEVPPEICRAVSRYK
jgi:hypothetical protein